MDTGIRWRMLAAKSDIIHESVDSTLSIEHNEKFVVCLNGLDRYSCVEYPRIRKTGIQCWLQPPQAAAAQLQAVVAPALILYNRLHVVCMHPCIFYARIMLADVG